MQSKQSLTFKRNSSLSLASVYRREVLIHVQEKKKPLNDSELGFACGRCGLPWWLSSKESAMQEMRVRSLGQEDPLRRKWQPTPVFLPGKSNG